MPTSLVPVTRARARRRRRRAAGSPFTFVVAGARRRLRARGRSLAGRSRRGARALARDDAGRGARRPRRHAAALHRAAHRSAPADARHEPASSALTALLIALVVVARGVLYVALDAARAAAAADAARSAADDADAGGGRLAGARSDRAAALRAAAAAACSRRRRRAWSPSAAGLRGAGVADGWLLWGYERLLRRVVADTDLDLLHFSLHPLSGGAPRGRVRAGAAARRGHLGRGRDHPPAGDAAGARRERWPWRARRRRRLAGRRARRDDGRAQRRSRRSARAAVVALLVAGGVRAGAGARRTAGCAASRRRARLAVFFLALLAPALAMYPSLLAHATEAKERLVATTFGPQAAQPARRPAAAAAAGASIRSTRCRRSPNWSRLDVATPRRSDARVRRLVADRSRDLSPDLGGRAVRRRRPPGQPRSRSACPSTRRPRIDRRGCSWDEPFDEVSPFGSSERHVLRTGRGVCVRGRIVGSIVVRVMLDYRTLPFISSQSPYLESLRPNRQVAAGRRVGPRRRVRRLRLEPRADLRVGHARLDAAGRRSSSGWSSRASRSGRRSIATTRRSASTSSATAAASTRSAIRSSAGSAT